MRPPAVRRGDRIGRHAAPLAGADGCIRAWLVPFVAVTLAACAPLAANETATRASDTPRFPHPRVTAPIAGGDAAGLAITRPFGVDGHRGEDWTARGALGAEVVAIAAGEVVFAGNGDRDGFTGWGNVVIVRHRVARTLPLLDEEIESLYGHLEEVRVRARDRVETGRVLGTVGTGGGRYAPHLHFEIRERLKLGIQAGSGPLDGWLDPSDWLRDHGATLVGLTHRTP